MFKISVSSHHHFQYTSHTTATLLHTNSDYKLLIELDENILPLRTLTTQTTRNSAVCYSYKIWEDTGSSCIPGKLRMIVLY